MEGVVKTFATSTDEKFNYILYYLMEPNCLRDKTQIKFCINNLEFNCTFKFSLMPLLNTRIDSNFP